jgi:small subunit ribosomal protein S2
VRRRDWLPAGRRAAGVSFSSQAKPQGGGRDLAAASVVRAGGINLPSEHRFEDRMTNAELVKALVDAGVHFGHPASRWNPKMAPFIHGKRNNVHIIDVKETIKGLLRAKKLVQQVVAGGKDVLFVGTKRQARHAVEDEAARCGMHYVSERWLGGTLTNFRTIRQRLNRLEELEKLWESGAIEGYSKKMKSTLKREKDKIKANLEGIRRMDRMPGVMFIVDTRREHIAVKEAKKQGVKTIAVIDTDSDPTHIDLPIPANDDAMKALEIILSNIADTIIEAKAGRGAEKTGGDDAATVAARRRSSRTQFRADDAVGAAGADAGSQQTGSETQTETPAVSGGDPTVPAGA